MLIGPFFFVPSKKEIIYHACTVEQGQIRGGKHDDPYGHERLWDDHYSNGDYINYPRGRVIYDSIADRAIIYIDKCIDKPGMIAKLKEIFKIGDLPCSVEYDFHYQCLRCLKDIWDD